MLWTKSYAPKDSIVVCREIKKQKQSFLGFLLNVK